MAAGLFFTLGTLTNRLGTHYIFLRPKIFSSIFIGCDVVSLVIQAVGGADASISFQQGRDPEKGAKIMVGGIIFQIGECPNAEVRPPLSSKFCFYFQSPSPYTSSRRWSSSFASRSISQSATPTQMLEEA